MRCAQARDEESMERYYRGELSEVEEEELEAHYFECDDCLAELEMRFGLREELARQRSVIEAEGARRFSGSWPVWLPVAAALLVALGLALWLGLDRSNPLAELATIEPPLYEPVRLREAADEAAVLFLRAMEQYRQGDYEAAIPDLEAAVRLDVRAPGFSFFLGACYLLTGETDRGIESLRRTVELGDTPYLEEAHLLLARAYLQKRDPEGAIAELHNALRLHGDLELEARRLLEEIEDLRTKPG
jgi:tetratricopeptide (TPR) repeat protein